MRSRVTMHRRSWRPSNLTPLVNENGLLVMHTCQARRRKLNTMGAACVGWIEVYRRV